MSQQTVAGLIEEWQTGASLLFGSVAGGVLLVLGVSLTAVTPTPVAVLGMFLLGTISTFLLLSYLLYGQ